MQADLLLQSLKSKCSSSLWTQIEPRTNDKVLENNSIVYMQLYMRSIRLKQHLNSVLGSGEGCTFFIHPTNMALAVDFSGFLFSFPGSLRAGNKKACWRSAPWSLLSRCLRTPNPPQILLIPSNDSPWCLNRHKNVFKPVEVWEGFSLLLVSDSWQLLVPLTTSSAGLGAALHGHRLVKHHSCSHAVLEIWLIQCLCLPEMWSIAFPSKAETPVLWTPRISGCVNEKIAAPSWFVSFHLFTFSCKNILIIFCLKHFCFIFIKARVNKDSLLMWIWIWGFCIARCKLYFMCLISFLPLGLDSMDVDERCGCHDYFSLALLPWCAGGTRRLASAVT